MKDLAQRFSVEVINKQTGDIIELTGEMDVPTAGHFYPALKVLADRAKYILQRELDARRGDLPRVEANLGGNWYELKADTYPSYDGPALYAAMEPFIEQGLLTRDELDLSVARIVTWKPDGNKLRILKARGQALAQVIDAHCERVARAPSFGIKEMK